MQVPVRRGTAQRLGLRPPDGSGILPRPIDFGVFGELTDDETERWRQRLNSMLAVPPYGTLIDLSHLPPLHSGDTVSFTIEETWLDG